VQYLFAANKFAIGFALSTIGLVNPSYQACYLLVAGFFVSAQSVDVNLTGLACAPNLVRNRVGVLTLVGTLGTAI